MMQWLTISRAVLVRLLFGLHSLIAVWLLCVVTDEDIWWCLAASVAGLLIESAVTLYKNKGQEWKWMCPSVLFYLVSIVPAIWLLELHHLRKRVEQGHAPSDVTSQLNSSLFNMTARPAKNRTRAIVDIHVDFLESISQAEDRYHFEEQLVRTNEQILLLCLILGRWLLPKGKLTHDQLSELMLVYIGTAADICEFLDAFKEDVVRTNEILCIVILAIWSLSLLQFTLVITAAKARTDKSGIVARRSRLPSAGTTDPGSTGCTPEILGIVLSMVMQDAPFLVLRMLLIFKYEVISYTNMFFTCKNSLVCALLTYRLVVIQLERHRERAQKNASNSQSGEKIEGIKKLSPSRDESLSNIGPGEGGGVETVKQVVRNKDEGEREENKICFRENDVEMDQKIGKQNRMESRDKDSIVKLEKGNKFKTMVQNMNEMSDEKRMKDSVKISSSEKSNRSKDGNKGGKIMRLMKQLKSFDKSGDVQANTHSQSMKEKTNKEPFSMHTNSLDEACDRKNRQEKSEKSFGGKGVTSDKMSRQEKSDSELIRDTVSREVRGSERSVVITVDREGGVGEGGGAAGQKREARRQFVLNHPITGELGEGIRLRDILKGVMDESSEQIKEMDITRDCERLTTRTESETHRLISPLGYVYQQTTSDRITEPSHLKNIEPSRILNSTKAPLNDDSLRFSINKNEKPGIPSNMNLERKATSDTRDVIGGINEDGRIQPINTRISKANNVTPKNRDNQSDQDRLRLQSSRDEHEERVGPPGGMKGNPGSNWEYRYSTWLDRESRGGEGEEISYKSTRRMVEYSRSHDVGVASGFGSRDGGVVRVPRMIEKWLDKDMLNIRVGDAEDSRGSSRSVKVKVVNS